MDDLTLSPHACDAIRPLAEADLVQVEALLDQAFGTDRHNRTAYRIRDGMTPLTALSCCTLAHGGGLAGVLQCWPVALGPVPLVLVGPVAVEAGCRGAGIGGAMMRHMLREAEKQAADPLVLIGDPEYYGRFGFSSRGTGGWTVPGPVERRRLLARVADGHQLPETGCLGPRR